YRMQAGIAMANLFAGRFDAASTSAEQPCRNQPGVLVALGISAASHALPARPAEARRAMDQLRELDPKLRIGNIKVWPPIRRPKDLSGLSEGLIQAGLPED